MNKQEILEVLEMLDIKVLENLFILSKTFKPDDLAKVTSKVQNKDIKNLILENL